MLETRRCARADCGEEFTEDGFHTMCPKCRKMIQREKERIAKRLLGYSPLSPWVDDPQFDLDWWLPQ